MTEEHHDPAGVFRTAAELAFEFVFVLKRSEDGTPERVWAHGPFLELTGLTREEADSAGGFMTLVPAEDRPGLLDSVQQAFAQPDPISVEFRIADVDGELRWMRALMKRVIGRDGDVYIHGAYQEIGELKKSEEDRKRSEERYRAVSELTSDYAYSLTVNEDGSFEYDWETEGSFAVRFTPDEVKRAGWQNLIVEEDLPIAFHSLEELRAGRSTVIEVRIHTQEGTIEWVRAYSHPVIDPATGELVRIFGALQNVTERKQELAALEESESRYRQLVESSPDAIALHRDGVVVYVNPAALRLLGAETPDQLVGRSVMDFVPPGAEDLVARRLAQVHETGKLDVAEEQLLRLDGSRVDVEVTGSLVSFKGAPAVQLVIRDVTERKEARRALAENQRLLQQLADSISEVFFVSDKQSGKVLFASPAYAEIWGRPLSSLREAPLSWLWAVHTEDRDKLRGPRGVVLQGEPYEVEYRVVRPDGSQRWVLERGAPVRNERGNVVRIAGIARDITERKHLEAQLLQSQKMEAVGRLAGGVAHDFNNLLMIVLNSARFLAEDLKNEPERLEDLEQIIGAGERAAVLVRQLLAYSRKQVVTPKVVSLNDIVADMKSLLERTIGEDITLMTRAAPDLRLTEVDPHQMEQVVLNLIVNARDSMPNGGTVSIETSNVHIDEDSARMHGAESPGDYVCLTVSDTGSGIEKALLRQIFEPFFSTKPKSEATGLGLSMVYGIVTQAGGQVVASSEPGMGSTFRVYLPVSDGDAHQHPAPSVSVPRPAGGQTVLVAEDDEQVCDVTTRILDRSGYRVLTAHSGAAALEAAREHNGEIDVLLTDVVMPNMSGRELGSRMKLLVPDIRIVYMSGYTADIIGRHGILDDDENYLQKPFTTEELLAHLEQALRG